IPVRPEATHRRLDDDREEDKAPDGPGPNRQVVRLVQDQVLPDPAERLERRLAEEEAVAGVVRDAPDRHCPLIRVREVEEGPFDPASARGREAGRSSHDGGVSEGQEDVLDEVWWQEAVRIDEQERVPGCRCGTAVPALPRPAALPLQDGGPRRAGDVPGPIRAARIRDDYLVRRDGLAPPRFEQGGKILRLVPGRHDDGDPGRRIAADRGVGPGGLSHGRHAATRRSYTRSRRRVHRSTEYRRAVSPAASRIPSGSRRQRRIAAAQPRTSFGSKRAPFTPSCTNSRIAR